MCSAAWAAAVFKIVTFDLSPKVLSSELDEQFGSDLTRVKWVYVGYVCLGNFQLWLTVFTLAGVTEIATAGATARYYFSANTSLSVADKDRKKGRTSSSGTSTGGPLSMAALGRSITSITVAMTSSLGAAVMGGVV